MSDTTQKERKVLSPEKTSEVIYKLVDTVKDLRSRVEALESRPTPAVSSSNNRSARSGGGSYNNGGNRRAANNSRANNGRSNNNSQYDDKPKSRDHEYREILKHFNIELENEQDQEKGFWQKVLYGDLHQFPFYPDMVSENRKECWQTHFFDDGVTDDGVQCHVGHKMALENVMVMITNYYNRQTGNTASTQPARQSTQQQSQPATSNYAVNPDDFGLEGADDDLPF